MQVGGWATARCRMFKRRGLWHRAPMFRMSTFVLTAVVALAAATSAAAADRIRLAVQRTGTLAWELDVIRTHRLDRKLDLAIETTELASTEAGKIALKGGSADLMLSDWLWVARERSLGDTLVFYPSSSTLGAVMVPGQSTVAAIGDLRARKLAVAGGPLDKSWLLLQAFARRDGIDLAHLEIARIATVTACARVRLIAVPEWNVVPIAPGALLDPEHGAPMVLQRHEKTRAEVSLRHADCAECDRRHAAIVDASTAPRSCAPSSSRAAEASGRPAESRRRCAR